MNDQKHFPINWRDGMKINKSHFMAQEDALVSQLARATACLINEHNYGLLPAPPDGRASLKLFLNIDKDGQLHLRLQHCLAITRGGHFIEFDEAAILWEAGSSVVGTELYFSLDSLTETSPAYYIVLATNPYERVVHGLANPQEQPARIPHTMPAFQLSLMTEQDGLQNLIGLYHLPIGKVLLQDGKLVLDEGYIPPCRSLSSHPQLINIHADAVNFCAKTETGALEIIRKIAGNGKGGDIASIVQKLSEDVLSFTALNLAQIKTTLFHQSPVVLVCLFSSLARQIKNTLDSCAGTQKEELVNYCTKWCGFTPDDIEGSIIRLANHSYNHLDLKLSIERVNKLIQILSALFARFSRLDFIGERDGKDIFIDEKIMLPDTEASLAKSKASWWVGK